MWEVGFTSGILHFFTTCNLKPIRHCSVVSVPPYPNVKDSVAFSVLHWQPPCLINHHALAGGMTALN